MIVFGRNYIFKTIFSLLICALFIRLGIWQLDRREWRAGENATLAAQLAQPAVDINAVGSWDELLEMTDRKISAEGAFDFSQQRRLKNQSHDGTSGFHLIAPFVLANSNQAILVDRGWLDLSEGDEDLTQFHEQLTQIEGVVRQSTNPRTETEAAASDDLFRITVPELQQQMPYDLLPIYLLQSPTTTDPNARPLRVEPEFDLSAGPHLGYAIQWFAFAAIFAGGYLAYVRKTESRKTA